MFFFSSKTTSSKEWSSNPHALPRAQQEALLNKVEYDMRVQDPATKFYNSKRLRQDCMDVMDQHSFLQPSFGTLEEPDQPSPLYVTLKGTVQMMHDGQCYNVPLAIFLGTNYPQQIPICYIQPEDDLVIPPRHPRVSNTDGRVYLKCLNAWSKRSNLQTIISELAKAFVDQPFIYSRPPPVASADSIIPSAPPDEALSLQAPPMYQHPARPAEADLEESQFLNKLATLEEAFYCPISLEIMCDPVFASDGHTYERKDIEDWLSMHNTSPTTGLELECKFLVPNHNLRSQIQEYLQTLKA